MVLPLPPRRLAAAALLLALLASCSRRALGFTLPDQYEKISAFRDAMLARPGQQNWTKALASWRCPTDPANTVGSSCDPCGQQVWGNWEHLACRGPRISFTESQVPGTGVINHIHITDYSIEGAVPLEELCPLSGLVEFDVDGGLLTGPIPTGFARCFPELRELDLSYNRLTGTLPKEIAQVETLEQFKVEHNQLTGTIPAEYGTSMGAMNWMRLSDNRLVGTVPKSLAGTAAHLSQLTLDNNNLEGNLYALARHSMINADAANNPDMCGMVPVGLRFAHGWNFRNTRLGLPCQEEVAAGWQDLSEML